MNITLRVDDDIIKKIRKIAIDKNTTLTQMIRDYLYSVAKVNDIEQDIAIKELDALFIAFSRDMGPRTWKREELYER